PGSTAPPRPPPTTRLRDDPRTPLRPPAAPAHRALSQARLAAPPPLPALAQPRPAPGAGAGARRTDDGPDRRVAVDLHRRTGRLHPGAGADPGVPGAVDDAADRLRPRRRPA